MNSGLSVMGNEYTSHYYLTNYPFLDFLYFHISYTEQYSIFFQKLALKSSSEKPCGKL